jgi:hypothetical protein
MITNKLCTFSIKVMAQTYCFFVYLKNELDIFFI